MPRRSKQEDHTKTRITLRSLLKIPTEPDSGACAKPELCHDLVSGLEDVALFNRIKVISLVCWDSLFFKLLMCWERLETID